MVIEKLDLDKLTSYGLSPNEYVVLYLLINNEEELHRSQFDYEYVLKKLRTRDIIDHKNEILKELPDDLFGKSVENEKLEEMWIEFKETYPKKDGTRRLHDSPSSCKKKYIRLLKSKKAIHEDVIEGLKTEMALRSKAQKRDEFFQAPKLMSTYINNKSWEGYLNEQGLEEEAPNKDMI